MPRRGLTPDVVVEEAARMVAEKGLGSLSIRELAARLDVKPASLYNHIKGAGELEEKLAMLALGRLTEALAPEGGDSPAEAIRGLAYAYREFAHANPELYKTIVLAPRESEGVWKAERELLNTIERVAEPVIPDEAARLSYVRALRSSLHGFVSLEEAGFFLRPEASVDDSFADMVEAFARALDGKEG